jgi:hypothetical protein
MNKTKRGFLVVAFIVLVVLFLCFGSGTMMHSGMNGRMNENGWIASNSWGWFPAIVTLGFGLLIGWLMFRKKN